MYTFNDLTDEEFDTIEIFKFTGILFSQLDNFPSLQELYIQNNSFSGSIADCYVAVMHIQNYGNYKLYNKKENNYGNIIIYVVAKMLLSLSMVVCCQTSLHILFGLVCRGLIGLSFPINFEFDVLALTWYKQTNS